MNTLHTLLLACDLDRTILPNGNEPLSDNAMNYFRNFVTDHDIILTYISGRNLSLLREAINTYKLPQPDIVVGDVGTSLYTYNNGEYELDAIWSDMIATDWNGYDGSLIHELLEQFTELSLQEEAAQNTYKLSYYTDPEIDKHILVRRIDDVLKQRGIKAGIIFSIDQMSNTGLMDILPASATKQHALAYIKKHYAIQNENVVFAGDSGNDIDALLSGCYAILVKNARAEVKSELQTAAQRMGINHKIYFAQGGYLGMNGNYVAGVLEGINFFQEKNLIKVVKK